MLLVASGTTNGKNIDIESNTPTRVRVTCRGVDSGHWRQVGPASRPLFHFRWSIILIKTTRGGSRNSEKGGLVMNNEYGGEGAGGGTPPAQLGVLGERCKLPQQEPTLFYYIML